MPNSTVPVTTTSKTLLTSSKDSRDTTANCPPAPTRGARQANRIRELPTMTANRLRMNTPRAGSVANACTEVSTPERTRKAPKMDSEKVLIASNTVQFLKLPRFSVTASE